MLFTIASAKTYTNEKGTFTNGVKHQEWGNHNSKNSRKQGSKKKKNNKSCKQIFTIVIYSKGKKEVEIPFEDLYGYLSNRKSGKKLENKKQTSNLSRGGDGSGRGRGDGNGKGDGSGNGDGGGRGNGEADIKANKKPQPLAMLFPSASALKFKACSNNKNKNENEKTITKKQFNNNPACHVLGFNRKGQIKLLECGVSKKPGQKMKTVMRRITSIEIFE